MICYDRLINCQIAASANSCGSLQLYSNQPQTNDSICMKYSIMEKKYPGKSTACARLLWFCTSVKTDSLHWLPTDSLKWSDAFRPTERQTKSQLSKNGSYWDKKQFGKFARENELLLSADSILGLQPMSLHNALFKGLFRFLSSTYYYCVQRTTAEQSSILLTYRLGAVWTGEHITRP